MVTTEVKVIFSRGRFETDQDNILEPNEAFVLFVYPSTPLPPSTPFTVTISMPEENALMVNRTVPVQVKPVMNLG